MTEVKARAGSTLEVKRLYVPVKIKTSCPHCEKPLTRNMDNEYLSAPTIGEPEDVYFYCGACEGESNLPVTLNVSISYDPKGAVKA